MLKGKHLMSVSDRYRELVKDVRALLPDPAEGEETGAKKLIRRAARELEVLEEQVGEIPRIQLEGRLTPVLLKAHSLLDRSRLLLEEQGVEDHAASVWELEQKIYRLLNAL
jgi:hypothetical protein